MALTFRTRPLGELPPDPKDQYGELEHAFRHLAAGQGIFVEMDVVTNKRAAGQVKAAIKKRFGKEAALYREAPDGSGLWVWSKAANQPGGSNAERPFSHGQNGNSASVTAAGAGAR